MKTLGWTLVVSITAFMNGQFLLNHTVDGAFDPRFPTHFPTKAVCERFADILMEKYASSILGLSATCMRDLTEGEKEELAEILKSLTVKAP